MQLSPSLHSFTVSWVGPLDIPASLEMFRRWGDDGIDRWDGTVLVRTTEVEGQVIPFACTNIGTVAMPALEVVIPAAETAPQVEAVVQRMFVTAPQALEALMATDAVVARVEERFRGVRPVLQNELYMSLVRSISAQQVNLRWAATTRQRLAEAFGQVYRVGHYETRRLDMSRLARADVSELRDLQFTTRKSEYIIGLARLVDKGELDLNRLRHESNDEVITRLMSVRGLGRWTAEWFLARSLGRPCVVAGDLGVRKAVGAAYLAGEMPSELEVRQLTAHWGDAAGVAQQLLLHELSEREVRRT